MGLEILEEKFQNYVSQNPEKVVVLRNIASQASDIQQKMRALLDGITAVVCRRCSASCCQCMPVEGWFTEHDYFLYRMLFEAPFNLRVDHGLPRGCAFLGKTGCVLPSKIRPFPCVKVNCETVRDELEIAHSRANFQRLYDELDQLSKKIWPLLKDTL